MLSNFAHFSDFLAMGGYAAYVWPVYGLTAVVLVGQVLSALRTKNKNKK